MPVEVRVASVMQKLTGEKVLRAQGNTVGEVLEELERRFPGIKSQVIDEGGDLHRFVNVYRNDEDIRYLGRLETPLADGDTLSILPALAGGS